MTDRSALGPALTAQVTDFDGVVVINLAGELDIGAAATMGEVMPIACSACMGRLTVDVSGVTFMDAAGLNLLIGAQNRLVGAGWPGIEVREASGMIRRIFELTGTSALLGDRESTVVTRGPLPEPSMQGRRLDVAREEAGVSVQDLFVEYFALGGTADFGDLNAHLRGEPGLLDSHQQDVAIHALNERLIELGRTDRLMAYVADGR